MQAILAGDTSGAIVHPAFTYIAQLLGCHMWQLQRRMMMFDAVEARQEILLVHALQHIDPISEIQVRYQFACFLLLRQRMEEGEQQLVIAAHVVQRHCLNFPIPPQIMHTHDISQTEAELITGLAHFMYLDRCSSFVFRVPMRLDKSFDQTFDTVTVSPPSLTCHSISLPTAPRSPITPCSPKRTSFISAHAACSSSYACTTSKRTGVR